MRNMETSNPHYVTYQLEKEIARYTGAPYCVCVDNESNALYMTLVFVGVKDKEILIPPFTYPSVACEIINAGGKVKFDKWLKSDNILTGQYQLKPTNVWDSALTFTADMFKKGQFQCLSFTGQWKRLKTVKGGAILTDSVAAYKWFKKYRFSGRNECSYHADNFTMIGHNYYMPHILAAIGLQTIQGFYNLDGTKKHFEDISLPYPDLSKFPIYKT